MSETRITELVKVQLQDPILVQGLPGLGFVGKVAVDYFIEKLKAKKFAELHSTYLTFPDGSLGVNINSDGTFNLPKYEFYYYNGRAPNFIFLTGDGQPNTSGQIEVADKVLDYVSKLGCRTLIGLGGYGTRSDQEVGFVYTVLGELELGKELQEHGAKIARGGAVTGACGIILGLGARRNMKCLGLLGATRGVYPDLEAARSVVNLISSMYSLPVELKDLDQEIAEMKVKVSKAEAEVLGEQKEEEKREGRREKYIT